MPTRADQPGRSIAVPNPKPDHEDQEGEPQYPERSQHELGADDDLARGGKGQQFLRGVIGELTSKDPGRDERKQDRPPTQFPPTGIRSRTANQPLPR